MPPGGGAEGPAQSLGEGAHPDWQSLGVASPLGRAMQRAGPEAGCSHQPQLGCDEQALQLFSSSGRLLQQSSI
jgi:hypothetical protein